MIIKPKVRGFVCVTAHPDGCAAHVQEQIDYVKRSGALRGGPQKVLVIGASTGYGLAARVVSAFACNAATLGVFFERPAGNGKPASAGYYNSVAFETAAHDAGLWARSINGDAFQDDIKEQTVELIRSELGSVDAVIYSLASPRRTDPESGITYTSVLKPIGQSFSSKTVDTDKQIVHAITLDPAEEAEVNATIKVMGGEDWERWINCLMQGGVLADGVVSVAFDYVGPILTWPIYKDGAIGQAKRHLLETARRISGKLEARDGKAFLSVNKAVVTQASSAIPVVPLYLSILFRVMKEKGIHEGCIEQLYRLFRDRLFEKGDLDLDAEGRIRIDDWEMREDVQAEVRALWDRVCTENLNEIADYSGYRADFLRLFGFGMEGVDYDTEVDPVRQL